MDQIIFVESVAQVPMNNIEEAPIQENKQPAQGQLDEMTKHDTDQLEEGIEEEIEEDFDLGQWFTAEWEPEDEKNIDEANSEPTDYYAQEVWDYEDAETDDEIPADLDVYDNDLDEDFILSDQWFEFDYEIDEDEEFPIE